MQTCCNAWFYFRMALFDQDTIPSIRCIPLRFRSCSTSDQNWQSGEETSLHFTLRFQHHAMSRHTRSVSNITFSSSNRRAVNCREIGIPCTASAS